jgi:hypothetical protein
MVRSLLTSSSLALSWMLSPDALIILANSIGQSGMMFFVPFTIGVILSALAINLIHHPAVAINTGNSFTRLAGSTGLLPAMTLTLASRLCLVLLLPTGMLVTAGFSFNETFLYWFPNFGFSFLLLGIILLLHLVGMRTALAAQTFFICLTICCLVLLCLAGLLGSHELKPTQFEPGNQLSLTIPLVFTALLLFLGYDRFEHPNSTPAADSRAYYIGPLIAGSVLLAVWAFVSLKYVPQAKLANSTIPYIISAREILGQPGRIIMGIAVISGTCGVVNGLFLLANRSLQQITDHIFLPSNLYPFGSPFLKERIWPVIFSLFIGIFMAFGLAGSENLDIYMYGALLFWLLTTGMHCFATARNLHKQKKISAQYWQLLTVIFPLAAVWLACINVHATTLVVFCFLVLGGCATISGGLFWYDRKINNKSIQDSRGDIS